MKIQHVCAYLEEFAPLRLAEDWDNVGLLLGDRERSVSRIMTCLTVTPESVAEAIDSQVDLIVTHHPLPFRAVQKITTDAASTRLILQLAQAGISIYSPHTAFDSTIEGINDQLAQSLNLNRIGPLKQSLDLPGAGPGRYGETGPFADLQSICDRMKSVLQVEKVQASEQENRAIKRLALACGSGGSFLATAAFRGCDALLTGEATFHSILEARALGIALILVGHFASERFAMERLAERMAGEFSDCDVWASRHERSPLSWY